MKRFLFFTLFCLFIGSSAFAMGPASHSRGNGHSGQVHNTNDHRGGSGIPEPVSILLILGGGAVAFGIKKAIKK